MGRPWYTRAVRVIDVNTSAETIDGTPPGQVFSPMRYTSTTRDMIRVSVWLVLATIAGAYQLDVTQGLDVLAMLDGNTSEAERAALVAEVVLGIKGVTGILEGPIVTVTGATLSVFVRASTIDGPIEVST